MNKCSLVIKKEKEKEIMLLKCSDYGLKCPRRGIAGRHALLDLYDKIPNSKFNMTRK